ncbi:MAG: hypothetical protein L0Y50_07110 [Beijerinckiaceae bacterium]|nr:hypothetical protein [Beijerinckiaceae bacterium]MCI0736026.1 hypothetical protein [Beijerinckiaceae bacterium]
MDTISLQKIISTHVDARFKGLEDAVLRLESCKPFMEDGGLPGQPCDTQFTTTGVWAPLDKTGFNNAYNDAKTRAQIICNTGQCTRVVFVKYDQEEPVPGVLILKITWQCKRGAV